MSDAHGVARDQLRAFIERIERLEEEKKSISDDIKDVYGEAKGMGFIPAMMKKVIALRKKDELQRMEEEAILDTYLHALGMIQADLFEEPARQATPHDPETGEILEDINPRLAKQVVDGMQTEAGRAALIAAVDILIEQEEAEEFQAKASGDNGAIVQAEKVPADSVTGDASRSSRGDDSPAPNQPETADRSGSRPADPAVSGGEPGIPSSDAGGVKMEEGCKLPPGRRDVKSLHSNAELERATITDSEIDPNEDREEGHSLDGNADGNAGGGHVNDQSNAATHGAGALVKPAPARKPLRPLCRNPGDNCAGYGSTHCASCIRASKQAEEVAA